MAEEEEVQEEVVEKPKGSGGPPIVVLLAGTAVVTLIVAVAISFFLFKSLAPSAPAIGGDEETSEEEPVDIEPVFKIFRFPSFKTNLAGGGYVKATISLELADRSAALMAHHAESGGEPDDGGGGNGGGAHGGGEEAEPEPAEELDISPLFNYLSEFSVKYEDIILSILRKRTVEDLSTGGGDEELKKEIRLTLNLELDPELGQVRNVFISELATQ